MLAWLPADTGLNIITVRTLNITLLVAVKSYGSHNSVLSLFLTNYALRHEDVWGSVCIDPHFLHLGGSWR
jgi:hypothetical protein